MCRHKSLNNYDLIKQTQYSLILQTYYKLDEITKICYH